MQQRFLHFNIRQWFDKACRQGIYRILLTQAVLFLLFWLGGFFTPIQHKFFYVDYLFLPFIFRLHWILGVFAAIPMVLFNIYFSLDSANGLSLIALLGLIREIPHAGMWAYQLAFVAVGLFSLLVFFVVKQYQQVSLKAAVIVLGTMMLLYYPAKKMLPKWPILSTGLTSPVLHMILFQDTFFFERLNPGNMLFSPLSQPSLLARSIEDSPKVLSILFESYGIDKTRPQINLYFADQLRKALPNRKIETEIVTYSGSTVNGELRELCSVKTEGVMLDSVPNTYQCVPEKLGQEGYTTVAFHNNKAGFYDRLRWYPSIGFSHFIDLGKMLEKGYRPSFYAFGGISDQDMAKEISDWLKNNKRIFAHWITLDSHGPYTKSLAPETVDCHSLHIEDAMECHYVNQLQSTFIAIVSIAKEEPDVKIVISGDHAPHFESMMQPVRGKQLNALFDRQHVPALVIMPAKNAQKRQ